MISASTIPLDLGPPGPPDLHDGTNHHPRRVGSNHCGTPGHPDPIQRLSRHSARGDRVGLIPDRHASLAGHSMGWSSRSSQPDTKRVSGDFDQRDEAQATCTPRHDWAIEECAPISDGVWVRNQSSSRVLQPTPSIRIGCDQLVSFNLLRMSWRQGLQCWSLLTRVDKDQHDSNGYFGHGEGDSNGYCWHGEGDSKDLRDLSHLTVSQS